MNGKAARCGEVIAVILLLLLAAWGCAARQTANGGVITGSPVVYIRPLSTTELGRASALVPPFVMPAGIDVRQGEGVASLFQDVLLGRQAFRLVKRAERHYASLEEAIALGRAAKTDFVVAGQVHTLLSGTRLGGGRVDLSLRVIEVQSGHTLWYIRQALDQPMDLPDLSLRHQLAGIFEVPSPRPSEGAPTAVNMLAHIAYDMADVMAGADHVAVMNR